ncbi:Cna B-type domain-containing protein [Salinicoccus siamensis]|uniref:Cna B-type domain-containing protein n=1 Tax=Salinicoccus siamensis TaxID=381830 RepID=A0ABV5Z708_9STAP
MKKLIFIYVALLLILSSILTSPLSMVAAEVTNDEESVEIESVDPNDEGETDVTETEESTEKSKEPAPGAVDSSEAEQEGAEKDNTSKKSSEAQKEEVVEEKRGLSVGTKKALNLEGTSISSKNPIKAEETFILELEAHLSENHNYGVEDKVTYNLPASLNVVETVNDFVASDTNNVASYTVNSNGVLEIEFLEAVAVSRNENMTFTVQVAFDSNHIAEGAREAIIDPINNEDAIIVPLAVEETEEATEESTEEATEESTEETTEESTEEPKKEAKKEGSANKKEARKKEVAPLAELTPNIFEFRSLTHNGVEIVDGSNIDLSDGTEVELIYDWNTEGMNAQSGDTATIQIPDVFEQVSTPQIELVTNGVKVGTYQIQNGQLQIIFNDNIEEGYVSNGELGLNLKFDLQKFEENIEQIIKFNDTKGTELKVLAKPNNLASGITKEGHPDRNHNAKEITWTIDVINNSGEAVTTATLSDILPEGLGTPENFVINELSTNLSGDKVLGVAVDTITPNISETGFEIAFDNLGAYQGYRVQYTTPITDRTQTAFTNDATFYDGESNLPAEATVTGLTASNPIEKAGSYNKNTGQIDWTVVVNENGSAIENAVIDDVLPEGLSVDEGKFTVKKFVDGSSAGEISVDPKSFPIDLGAVAANEHFEIRFSTDIDYSKVNGGAYQSNNSFENIATLSDGDEEIGRDEAVVEYNRQPLLKKKASSSGIDYENKKLSWTVDLNKAQHELKDVVVTDTLPAGLTLTKDDIVIKNSEGENVDVAMTIAQGVKDSEGGEVTFNFGDIGTQHIIIQYNTEITDFSKNKFSNTIGIAGDGIGDEEHSNTVPVNPPANSFNKKFTGIDYNLKTMSWNLKVNPIREGIKSLVIEDDFPNKGMILIPETVKVSHSADGELTLGEDYTLEPRTEEGDTGYQKGFIIKMIGNYSTLDGGSLDVSYKTSYDPQFEVEGNTLDPHLNGEGQAKLYLNKANFSGETTSGHNIDINRNANTTVRTDSWNSGKKEGQLVHIDNENNVVNGWKNGTDRKVAWQLYTNYQQQNLGENVVVTDTLQYEGTIDADSIKVSTYNVSSDGKTTITNEVLDPSTYSLDVTGKTFTLTFNEEVSERYVIEFLTTVPNVSKENYTNKATVSVDGEDYPYSGTVSYKKYNDFLDKSSIGHEGSNIYIGENIDWQVQVNDSLSIIEDAEITDIISAGLEYIQGSLKVSTVDGNVLSEGEDYVFSTTKTEDGKTRLNIELSETLNQTLVLNYTTAVTAEDGDTVNNKVDLNGNSIERRTVSTEELTAEQFSWASGEFNPKRGALEIVKLDTETGEPIANNPAMFELYYELNGERVLFADEIQTDENGKVQIGNLPLRTYYLVETQAPTGYIIDETEKVIEITQPYGKEKVTYDAKFKNTKKKTDVSVTKKWDDAKDQDGLRPDTIAVQLLANGEPVEQAVTLSANNEWANTWTNLDAYQSSGKVIDYSVKEVSVPKGYKSTVSKDDDNNIVVTNTHKPETTEVSVTKEWDDADNQDGVRPDTVTVNLLNDSEIETSAVLSKENDWTHTFSDLPKFADGEKLQYSVTENTAEQYSTEIKTTETDKGFNSVITNTYTPKETSATVTKVWQDGNNQDGNRPDSIMVQLSANGEAYGDPVAVTKENNWTHTWSGLDLKSKGQNINYTVEELDTPEEYEVSVNNEDHGNLMITNAYTPEVTEVSVTKEWDDADNQDGVRPDEVTINLLNGSEIETSAVLSKENDWTHTFSDLPKYANGTEIQYSVTENTAEQYSTEIKTTETDKGFNSVITNTYTPKETSATVTKVWQDGNNQDGNRPDSVMVQLSANGEAYGDPVAVTKENNWTHTWSGLDLKSKGQNINYTVEELDTPEEYEVSVNNEDHGNLMITNAYTPEVTEVSVTKEWDDADNQDGVRPDNVEINLLADGEVVKTSVLGPASEWAEEWAYTFTDLPVYKEGEEINYTVTENAVPDYTGEIRKVSEIGYEFVVTNSHTPDKTGVTVTKSWEDSNNQDGNRPDSIEVQLTANGENHQEPVVLTAEDDWTYTWTDLDMNSDGEAIKYSVTELNVPEEYEVSVDDEDHGNLIIKNSYAPELIEMSVQKVWDDKDDQDRVRPDKVEVNLLANGEKVKEAHITKETDWQHVFTDLPKYENGQEIVYTLTENSVDNYSLTSNEFNEETEVHELTNSYTPEETSVTATKNWQDADNQENDRPDTIKLQLIKVVDGEREAVESPVEVSVETDWTYTWTGLDKNADGEPIHYTVEEMIEEKHGSYEVTVNDEEKGNIIITNSRTYETDHKVVKNWDDQDNKHDKRPDSIDVQLFQNGEATGEPVTLSEDNNWTHKWESLEKYDQNNEAYAYTAKEVEVPKGYTADSKSNEESPNTTFITNTLDPIESADDGKDEGSGSDNGEESAGDQESNGDKEDTPDKDGTQDEGSTEAEEDAGDQGSNGNKADTPDKDSTGDQEGLPDTGIASSGNIAIIAAILLIAGASILYFTRRRS